MDSKSEPAIVSRLPVRLIAKIPTAAMVCLHAVDILRLRNAMMVTTAMVTVVLRIVRTKVMEEMSAEMDLSIFPMKCAIRMAILVVQELRRVPVVTHASDGVPHAAVAAVNVVRQPEDAERVA